MSEEYFEGIGRRKRSTARVRLQSGTGQFIVNEKDLADFFPRLGDTEAILSPFRAAGEDPGRFDVSVIVQGGGVTGQRDSVLLGLARALVYWNPEVQPHLKKDDLLTRDSRIKERKKPGLKRARKAPTYTKR